MAVIRTIGIGTGLNITPDYTTLQDWFNYLVALGPFTTDQIGRVLWASSVNELVLATNQTLTGANPGSFSIILEAGDADGNQGGSFRDHATKTTNALRIDNTLGATIKFTAGGMVITDSNVTIRHLQIYHTSNSNTLLNSSSSNNTDRVLENCILGSHSVGSASIMCNGLRNWTLRNNLFYGRGFSAAGGGPVRFTGLNGSMVNNTLVNSNAVAAGRGVRLESTTMSMINNVIVGFNPDVSLGSGNTLTGSHNATDIASGSSFIPSTNAQYGAVGATEFESVTSGSEDFRLRSTSARCRDLGTSSGAPTTDIVGQARG